MSSSSSRKRQDRRRRHSRLCQSAVAPSLLQLLIIICVLLLIQPIQGSGELAGYTTTPLEADAGISHRQYVCDRYELFREGKIELRNALSGLSLRPLLLARKFFVYNNETGIPNRNPGLVADLMDAVAQKANFTWRDSFGIMELPQVFNKTWTEMLLWGVETYDIAVYSWDQSVERMEQGVAYVEPFFDGSLILIDQKDPPQDNGGVNLLNWTLPFEPEVWVVTIFTIILSACVYLLIEHLNDEREGRCMTQWFSDNLFLSSLNFTQNFEYAPNSVAGRIFSVSMGLWALVMTATYTANLASLFVEELRYPIVVDSIEQAIKLSYPICTYANTNADRMVKEKHPDAIRIPKNTELETFEALRRGECKLAVSYKDNWLSFRGNQAYNPVCDLEWVGRDVDVIKSGFAIKADAGYKCTSLIRDVFNLHLVELLQDGVLQEAWEEHRSQSRDVTCDLDDDDNSQEDHQARQRRRRSLNVREQDLSGEEEKVDYYVHAATPRKDYRSRNRNLKSTSGTTSKASSESSSDSSLTLKQMTGTFVLHWAAMAIALLVSFTSPYFVNWPCYPKGDRVVYRRHGPIIGQPPPVNTYAINRNRKVENCIAKSRRKFNQTTRHHQQGMVVACNFRNSLRDLANIVEDLQIVRDHDHSLRSNDDDKNLTQQSTAVVGKSDSDESDTAGLVGANSERFANRLHMWRPNHKEEPQRHTHANAAEKPHTDNCASAADSLREESWKKAHTELRRQHEALEHKMDKMDEKMDVLIKLMQNMNATKDAMPLDRE